MLNDRTVSMYRSEMYGGTPVRNVREKRLKQQTFIATGIRMILTDRVTGIAVFYRKKIIRFFAEAKRFFRGEVFFLYEPQGWFITYN